MALLLFLHFVDLEPIPRLRFGVTITTGSPRIQPRAALRCSSPRYPSLPRVQDAIETWCNRPSCPWRWQTAVAWRAKRALRRGQGELARYSQSWLVCDVVLSHGRLVGERQEMPHLYRHVSSIGHQISPSEDLLPQDQCAIVSASLQTG
jgi:hypothetical protein